MAQPSLTSDRAILLLEALWDQLELVGSSIRSSEKQPSAIQMARLRIAAYRLRFREVIATMQLEQTSDRSNEPQIKLVAAMAEVAEFLDDMQSDASANWMGALYQAQDAVLASLHDLRQIAYHEEHAAAAAFA